MTSASRPGPALIADAVGGLVRLAMAPVPIGVRRLAILVPFLALLVFVQAVHWLGFLLDEVFFRGYRKVEVREPLFVVGMPRSGTSFLHSTLAEDDERFTTLRLWELVLAPSLSERAFWSGLVRLDARLGAPLVRLGRALEGFAVDRMDGVHPVDFDEPGEDFLFLLPVFACFLLVAAFPLNPHVWALTRIDDWSPPRRRRLLAFYRSCLQRHLYWTAGRGDGDPGRIRILSKNPSFTACVRTLLETFPDARFVCCFRDVREAIPSQLSSLGPAAEAFGWNGADPAVRDRFVEMYDGFARRSVGLAENLGPQRCACLELRALSADVSAAVGRVYGGFGWSPSPTFGERLAARTRRSAGYTSRHRYDLDDFGLSSHDLERRFASSLQRLRELAAGGTAEVASSGLEITA